MYPHSFWKQKKYLNKFKTCCRVRPVEEQILGQEHYKKEHTKPLLNKQNRMTVHNLYVHHCSMDTFKTLKYRIPISLYSLYLLSNRNEAFLITPLPNSQFIYNASKIWNTIRETIARSNLSISICSLKSTLQKFCTFYEWDNQKTLIFFLKQKKKIWGNKKDMSSFYKIPLILYTFSSLK